MSWTDERVETLKRMWSEGQSASAIAKDPTTYEHVDPASVGNQRIVPMSNQAGQSNLRQRLSELYKAGKDQVSVFGFRTRYGGGKSTACEEAHRCAGD